MSQTIKKGKELDKMDWWIGRFLDEEGWERWVERD